MRPAAAVPRPSACDGCHGSRVCWVCQGAGCVPSPGSRSRCTGDGVCRLCLRVPVQRQADLSRGPGGDRVAGQA